MQAWVLSWRIVLRRGRDWPGPTTEVLTVASVAELRTVVMRARRDPSIMKYHYWRHREWQGPQPRACPRGDEYVPAAISDTACLCGTWHRVFRCRPCGTSLSFPEPGPGCGPVPHDPEPVRQHR